MTAVPRADGKRPAFVETTAWFLTSLERLRMNRQLEGAIAHRADPLHLAAVFGLDPKTALRYANSARQLLATVIESDPLG
jgi:hypothetical protein